ncbi:MAG: NusG domain II-containing protein [Clostridiales bacterium]|nr:NusG domain II-containing protein [Clostridiales bacterium]
MNRADRRLFFALLIVSFAGLILYFTGHFGGDYVVVEVDKKQYGIYPVGINRSIPITTAWGNNELVIEDGEVYMKEADCPDRLCVKHGKLLGAQDSIVCLPHKVVVTLKKGQAGEGETDATAQ